MQNRQHLVAAMDEFLQAGTRREAHDEASPSAREIMSVRGMLVEQLFRR
jgi:hypothetical protein